MSRTLSGWSTGLSGSPSHTSTWRDARLSFVGVYDFLRICGSGWFRGMMVLKLRRPPRSVVTVPSAWELTTWTMLSSSPFREAAAIAAPSATAVIGLHRSALTGTHPRASATAARTAGIWLLPRSSGRR